MKAPHPRRVKEPRMDPGTLSIILQLGELALKAFPGAIEAFLAITTAHNSGTGVTDEQLEAARLVISKLNAEIQAS